MAAKGMLLNANSVRSTVNSNESTLNAHLTNDEQVLIGILQDNSSLKASVNASDAPMSAQIRDDGGFATQLTMHYGADGKDGKDGFSPTITVHEHTEDTYILKITDVNGSYLTPNLQGQDGSGGGCGCIGDLDKKVDRDLQPYRLTDADQLTTSQRVNTLLYG